MLYKILYAIENSYSNPNFEKIENKTRKKLSSGLAKGGGKKTQKNNTISKKKKPLSIPKNKKNKTTNMEKQYRQKQTTDRRNKWKNST